MKRLLALLCICIYMFASQFITKARATTARQSFAIDEDCSVEIMNEEIHCPHTSAKLDTFESKKKCQGKTYGELQTITDLVTINNSKILHCIPNFGYIYKQIPTDNIYIGENEFRPPPDNDDIYDLTYYRTGIIEKRE